MERSRIDEVLDQLDKLIASHSILLHPFYQAWSAGFLTQADLSVYAWTYYPHIEAFPCYLRKGISCATHPEVIALLEDNLRDELHHPEPHAQLWRYFAEGLGINRQELENALPIPEVADSVSVFKQLCSQSDLSALAALYTYESQQPAVSKNARIGLCEHYQIHDRLSLIYFLCHEEADIRHSQDERKALGLCLEQNGRTHELFESAQAALDAHWGLLDGVCRQAGMSC